MLGLMQSQPLLISSLIEFAERHHGDAEIVSRRVEGDIHRYTYRDLARRLGARCRLRWMQGLARPTAWATVCSVAFFAPTPVARQTVGGRGQRLRLLAHFSDRAA